GMFEKARAELEKARDLIGEDPIVYDHLGDAYFKTGDLDKAREAWEKSLKLQDNRDVKEKLESLKAEAR
ncbi:MAG: tetratricopeptide repeat protein, partial [Candidatus Omnitrophica bacterium]|nr:tetratricopeptide repeat protein [Candidatus Omnitrophota bacterium]